ncbi:MAG TPA: MlaD family protein [Marmoricola sp.]|nr:MlaD family protein [Marmoricola sp.]
MRSTETRAAVLKLLAFAGVSGFVLITILATIKPFGSPGGQHTYTGVFTSASQLHPGDDVRVAGVPSGSIQSISLLDDGDAQVRFTLADSVPITTSSTLAIRYLDLAGNRYLAVNPGAVGAPAQPDGRTIGLERTMPALDINDLLQGFKPLLTGLDASAMNQLSLEIVQTLQGDGPTINALIQHAASLTGSLAQNDQLVGAFVSNLSAAVTTIATKHTQLIGLINDLRTFTQGLARDRNSVGQAITHIDQMTAVSQALLNQVRPPFKADLGHLRSVAQTLASPFGISNLIHDLDTLPSKLKRLAATASYGAWYNYYVCGIRVSVSAAAIAADPSLAALLEQIHIVDTAPRCAP